MNPLDAIKKEKDEIKHDIGVAVETIVQEGIAKVALSRCAVLNPDKAKYSDALKDLDG